MAKKNAVKAEVKMASISMSINNAHFEMTGDEAEVSAKFKVWLDEALAPIRKVREIAERELKK